MTPLTLAQQSLLTAAAANEDGAVDAADANPSTALALIKRSLIISMPQAAGGSRLMITAAGRTAINAPPALTAERTPDGPRELQTEVASEAQSPLKSEPKRPQGKIGALVSLLEAEGGATLATMMACTGWQAHSVRGALSGAIKKSLGLNVVSEKSAAGRIYRIVPAQAA